VNPYNPREEIMTKLSPKRLRTRQARVTDVVDARLCSLELRIEQLATEQRDLGRVAERLVTLVEQFTSGHRPPPPGRSARPPLRRLHVVAHGGA
jgi:hypothetical protein